MGFLRRKTKEQDDGSDRRTGTDSGHSSSPSSTGLVPGGVFSGPGIGSNDLARLYSQYAVPGSGSSLGRDTLSKALTDASAAMKNQMLYGSYSPIPSPTFSHGPVSATPPAPLKTESREDPVRAWKRIRLQRGNTWGMISRASLEPYNGSIAEAACSYSSLVVSPHTSPGASCTCGFYGYKHTDFEDFHSSDNEMNPWLEVDFYGKVIECEKGYRAEYQQPLRLHVEESFFEFVGGKHIEHYPYASYVGDSNSLVRPYVQPYVRPYVLPSMDYRPAVEGYWCTANCINPQTLAREIGIPVVVNGSEYK